MSSSEQLYDRLLARVKPLVSTTHIHQVANWLWITVGMIQAQSVALSQIATHIPGGGQAESRVTKIRRWLMNLHVEVWPFYRPLLEQVLSGWHAATAHVVLDGVMVFGDRWQIFRLSLVHGHRAIPLVWRVIPGTGNTQVARLEEMLRQAASFLASRVGQVVFLADRGFRDWGWAQLCEQVGWDYVIRLPANTYVTLANGQQGRIDQLDVPPGKQKSWDQVHLTQAQKLTTHLTVAWTRPQATAPAELLALISSQPAGKARLKDYADRMDIEQSFRDDKSAGFQLDHTRLRHADRLERLLLALAVATLWCHQVGEQVLAKGKQRRRVIDPGPKRELSLFQLGLRWLKRCLSTALHLLPHFTARLTPITLRSVVRKTKT